MVTNLLRRLRARLWQLEGWLDRRVQQSAFAYALDVVILTVLVYCVLSHLPR